MTPQEALESLGYSTFRPGQREVVESIVSGRDTLFITSTGSGKSVPYQLCSLLLPGITVVISPLISLMMDQSRQMEARGVSCGALHSLEKQSVLNKTMDRLRAGELRLIYVAPERFQSEMFRSAIGRQEVSLLSVDEIHCAISWGYDFRPEYMRIPSFHREIGSPPFLGLTATATPAMREDLIDKLKLRDPLWQIHSFDRPNILLEVVGCNEGTHDPTERLKKIAALCALVPDGAVMVYFATRKDVDEFASILKGLAGPPWNRPVISYHAGMATVPRREAQARFISEERPVVLATCAFGMGIDRPDVRMVIHHRHPGTLEGYYQEIGRAGRDGKPATAVLLFHYADRGIQDFFIKMEAYLPAEYRNLYRQVENGLYNVERDRAGLSHMVRAKILRRGERRKYEVIAPWGGEETDHLLEQAKAIRNRKEAALGHMLRYATGKGCLRKQILAYFGEPLMFGPDKNMCCTSCGKVNNGTDAQVS